MTDDQSGIGQAAEAAKSAVKVGRAAGMLANPAVWIAGVVALVILVVALILGIVIVGVSGASTGGNAGSSSQGSTTGDITESGNALREAFLAQKNITYQKAVIQEEIRDGGVADNVLKAVLAAARTKGIGTLAISAAGCRSHRDTGGLHCPTTPAQALDIGSVGTTNPKAVNKKICKDFKNGDPYKINELGGITSSAECIINGGKLNQPQFDSTDHVHVGTY